MDYPVRKSRKEEEEWLEGNEGWAPKHARPNLSHVTLNTGQSPPTTVDKKVYDDSDGQIKNVHGRAAINAASLFTKMRLIFALD